MIYNASKMAPFLQVWNLDQFYLSILSKKNNGVSYLETSLFSVSMLDDVPHRASHQVLGHLCCNFLN